MLKILQAFAKTSSATLISNLFSIITTKVLSMVLGPAGIGLYSIIKQGIQTFSALAIQGQMALTQGIASKKNEDRDKYVKTVFWLFIISAVILVIVLVFFADKIAIFVFEEEYDAKTIQTTQWLALPVFLMTINSFFAGLLNGYRAIGRLAISQMLFVTTIAALSYPVALVVKAGQIDAFIWMYSTGLIISILFGLYCGIKAGWLKSVFNNTQNYIHKDSLKHFFVISGGTLIVGVVSAITILIIRASIVKVQGLEEAGLFDASWTISTVYIMIIANSFITYYFPTLSNNHGNNNHELNIILINNVIRLTIILFLPVVVATIALKPLIITLLYSIHFIPTVNVMRWMLIGDYFKITGLILGIILIAFTNMKIFTISNIIWWLTFLTTSIISIYFFHSYEYISIIYLCLYCINLLWLLYYTNKKYNLVIPIKVIIIWVIGLLIISIASYDTWTAHTVNWFTAVIWIIMAVFVSSLLITKGEKTKIFTLIKNKIS